MRSAPSSPATTTPTTPPRPTGTRSSRVRPAQSPDSTASSPASTARSRNVDPIITCPAALTEPQNARVPEPDEIELTGGGRTTVHRRGQVVVRDTGPWTPAVHTLLRHLERVGFDAAPRLVGSGLDPDGRETLTYIDGEFTQPGPWSLDGAAAVGQLLRDLHQATATYQPAPDAIWFPWHGRKLGGSARVIGHCDVAPWNIVARDRTPVAFIDWEFAGPDLLAQRQTPRRHRRRTRRATPTGRPGAATPRHHRRLRPAGRPASRPPRPHHRVRH